MIFTYDKETGRVSDYSEGFNEVSDKFGQIKMTPTKAQMEKLIQNQIPFIRNKKLVFEKPLRMLNEEKNQAYKKSKAGLIEKLKNPQVALKDVRSDLIKLFS